jgi:hypothetical protein
MKPWLKPFRVGLQGQASITKSILADEALLFRKPQPEPSLPQGVDPTTYAHIPGYLAEQFKSYHDLI